MKRLQIHRAVAVIKVFNETSPNLQGSCRNTSRWMPAKLHGKRLRIDV